jgi:hypothetical protein
MCLLRTVTINPAPALSQKVMRGWPHDFKVAGLQAGKFIDFIIGSLDCILYFSKKDY